jgi:hypothetical protein
MARTATQLSATATIEATGSPGSVDPKMKTAMSAMSAPTTRRHPQPVMSDRASVGS